MIMDSVLLRCASCRTVNRVPAQRLQEQPRCGRCRNLIDFPRSPVPVTDSTFSREVLEHPGFVLIFFWAPWCAHCRGMFPIMDDLARQRAGVLKIGMINTEQETLLAGRFSVMSVPRLTLYRNGIVIDELNGAVPKPALDQWLNMQLNKPR